MWADENFDVLYLAPPPSKSYTRLSEGSEEKPRRASLLGQFFRSKSSIGRRLPSVSSARVFQLANAVEVNFVFILLYFSFLFSLFFILFLGGE